MRKRWKNEEKECVHNTTPFLKINFQVIEWGTMAIVNDRGVIVMEKVDKIQISHIETMWSIGMRAGEVRDHFFGM